MSAWFWARCYGFVSGAVIFAIMIAPLSLQPTPARNESTAVCRPEPVTTAPLDGETGAIAEIEEERRLLYVAMTRAKDNLHLIVPQRFFAHSQQSNGDRHMYASRTRFIP